MHSRPSRRIIEIILTLALTLCLFPAMPTSAADSAPQVSAKSCILINADSGQAIFEQNADTRLPIASTTKILTALVVLEKCKMDEKVEIKREWAMTEGSSMGLVPGEECTVRELLYGLLLASGNDAGMALACHTAGSVENFAEMMNEKAAELGMTNSHFTNPHGLDNAEHYSTARDMAKLAAAAMKNQDFALIASTKEIRLSSSRYFSNHNKLLWQCEGCIGLKTGYTSSAGRTLVSCCERDGTRLVCVTLCDGNDWSDHEALYDWGFGAYRTVTAVSAGKAYCTLPVISGTVDSVEILPEKDVRLFVKADDEVEISESLPKFAYAGAEKGERAGEVTVKVNGEERAHVALVYAETVELDKDVPLNFWERVRWAWYLANQYGYY